MYKRDKRTTKKSFSPTPPVSADQYPEPSLQKSTRQQMERWAGKTALITGASSGIGYALSRSLCELGMNVVGCARNIEKIEVR